MPPRSVAAVVPASSVEDERAYVRYTLANGMEVLLVHDPNMLADDEAAPTEEQQRSERASKAETDDEEDEDELMDDDDDDDDDDMDSEAPDGEEDEPEGEEVPGSGAGAPKKRAAASLCVSVGSFADPTNAQGLSHFLEHMVFMGSKEFPTESEYDAYLSRHGGASNAWTDTEQTTYHFDVDAAYLYGALCRFAGFFTAPLIMENACGREINAVDSEFHQTLQSDYSRVEQVQCHTSKPNHVFRKFSWGNKLSLLGNARYDQALKTLRGEVVKHHARHYAASRMALVIVGGQPLEVLQRWVDELFLAVPSKPSADAIATGPQLAPIPEPLDGKAAPPYAAFCPFEGGLLTYAKGVKQRHELHLTWALPPGLKRHYRWKVEDYLSALVGHEGAGSLLQYLKARSLATDVSAGVGYSGYERNNECFLFTVCVGLTDAGFSARALDGDATDGTFVGLGLAAGAAVHAYLRMLRERHASGIVAYAYDEIARYNRATFRYAEEEPSDEYASRLASTLRLYTPEDALTGDTLFLEGVADEARPGDETQRRLHEVAVACLSYMVPAHARYDVVSMDVDLPRESKHLDPSAASPTNLAEAEGAAIDVEPYFDTPFVKSRVSSRLLAHWEAAPVPAEMHVPAPNPFVPANFSLLCDGIGEREELLSSLAKCATPEVVDEARACLPETTNKGRSPRLSMAIRDPLTRMPPAVVLDEAGVQSWHKPDRNCHRSPRARVYLQIYAPALGTTAVAAAHATLFVRLLLDAATELTYVADTAGISTEVHVDGTRLEVQVDGFSDKLDEYMRCFVACLAAFDPSVDGGGVSDSPRAAQSLPNLVAEAHDAGSSARRYERVRELVLKEHRNFNLKPSRHVNHLRLLVLRSGAFPIEARTAAVASATAADVAATWRTARAECHVEAFVAGNADPGVAAQLARDVRGCLNDAARTSTALAYDARRFPRCACLPAAGVNDALPGRVVFREAENADETNTAVELYIQFGRSSPGDPASDALRARAALLEQVIEEPFFERLRTKEQLGYTAHASMRNSFGCVGFLFSIVSSKFDAHHVASRVYAFLAAFDIERSIDEAAYANHVSSLVSRKREPFANLADEANAHWATMYDAEYDFGRSLREAEAVARISRAELAAFYNAHVRPCARRCVFLDGSGAKAVEGDRRELLVVVAPKKGDAALDAATLRSRMAGACVDGSAVLSPDHVDGDAHAYGCGLPRW